MIENVDAILMVSGLSKRFGITDKLLQIFQGKPLVEHTLSMLCNHKMIGKVHFIYSSLEVGVIAKRYAVNAIYNGHPERGICESIRLGVNASNADFYLFVTGDQPMLDAATIEEIVLQKKTGCIIVPHHNGKSVSPVLFSSLFRNELLQLDDGETGQVIQSRNLKKVIPIEVKNAMALIDIDTKEDLRHLLCSLSEINGL